MTVLKLASQWQKNSKLFIEPTVCKACLQKHWDQLTDGFYTEVLFFFKLKKDEIHYSLINYRSMQFSAVF